MIPTLGACCKLTSSCQLDHVFAEAHSFQWVFCWKVNHLPSPRPAARRNQLSYGTMQSAWCSWVFRTWTIQASNRLINQAAHSITHSAKLKHVKSLERVTSAGLSPCATSAMKILQVLTQLHGRAFPELTLAHGNAEILLQNYHQQHHKGFHSRPWKAFLTLMFFPSLLVIFILPKPKESSL